jgi:dihydroorotate dehydrogenase
LRALQDGDRLDALLAALVERLRERAAAAGRARPKPMLVKLSPDLADDALAALVEVCLARGVDGLIATNTTLAREGLRAPTAEEGGLSGRPLAVRTLRVVRRLRALAGDRLPIIGCGGLATPADARALLDAGATLLQLYTSFIYEGPGIARRLARALS